MSENKRQIKLGAFLMETGHHIAAWRHPDAQADGGLNFEHYAQVARIAEKARFDAIFLPIASSCAIPILLRYRAPRARITSNR